VIEISKEEGASETLHYLVMSIVCTKETETVSKENASKLETASML